MLEIKPIQSKTEQEAACARCGIPYDADCMAYGAKENGELLGVAQFTFERGEGYVKNIATTVGLDDFEALFLMGRAVLNFIDLCGVHQAYFDGDVTVPGEKLLEAIGFRPDETQNGRLGMDLTGFFTTPCKHCQGK